MHLFFELHQCESDSLYLLLGETATFHAPYRLPFEKLFFEMDPGRPFERDARVAKELETQGLLRAGSPKPGRFEELKQIGRKLGYPI